MFGGGDGMGGWEGKGWSTSRTVTRGPTSSMSIVS